jgi:hypothetical protein
MFKREHHQRIQLLLAVLRTDVLINAQIMFAGGTRIVLDLQEYRESADVDFLCNAPGYGALRSKVMDDGYAALFHSERLADSKITFPRDIRIDRYGIRFPVLVAETPIKVEFVLEGRITLGSAHFPAWSNVPCLSPVDCIAEKLLANSDRWRDRAIFSRDLIDLGVMRTVWESDFSAAVAIAEGAYRNSILTDLHRTLTAFADDPAWRDRCYQHLSVDRPDQVFAGLVSLCGELEVAPFKPTVAEDPTLFGHDRGE